MGGSVSAHDWRVWQQRRGLTLADATAQLAFALQSAPETVQPDVPIHQTNVLRNMFRGQASPNRADDCAGNAKPVPGLS